MHHLIVQLGRWTGPDDPVETKNIADATLRRVAREKIERNPNWQGMTTQVLIFEDDYRAHNLIAVYGPHGDNLTVL